MSTAIRDGIITADTSVFDYGCGHGGDLERLNEMGVECSGWDPAFRASAKLAEADVVNLGYVVNVVEDPAERADALKQAWGLARSVLVVAARTQWDAKGLVGDVYHDGVVTKRDTFQKTFQQDELRAWIEDALGTQALAAAPGVFYAFRDPAAEQGFLASRYRRRAAAPRPRKSDLLFEEHQELLGELMDFFVLRGRLPRESELSRSQELNDAFGSIRRAFAVVRRVTGPDEWGAVREERIQDFLVYLALARFPKRPRFGQLPSELQYDVRDFFGTYSKASHAADGLLFEVGDQTTIDEACRSAGTGKLMPTALYLHASGIERLPPVLRAYEGCAQALTGVIEGANVVKLHRYKPKVSYLCYPDFENKGHPELAWSIVVWPGRLRAEFRDYRQSANPPILHRKEEFVGVDHDLHDRFARLTRQEERRGLLDGDGIGNRSGWEAALAESGLAVRGHRVVKA